METTQPKSMTDAEVPYESRRTAERHWETFCRAGVTPPCFVHAMGSWYRGEVVSVGRTKLTVRYESGTGKMRLKKVDPWIALPIVASRPAGRTNGWQANGWAAAYWSGVAAEIATAGQ
jgi:hypothetical protein